MGYTVNQQKVIDHFGKNLLVSAGAGSGKTSVLTEHVIKLITDETKPINIDNLLIVTFTNASASDMSEKINEAISKKLNDDSISEVQKEHLRKQQALAVNSHICTIDSFFAWIVKNNFEKSTLDPDYRLASEGELKLIRKEVFSDLINKKFATKDPDFYRFVETFSSDKDNTYQDIQKIFDSLYFKAESFADPISFINTLKNNLKTDYKELEDIPLFDWYLNTFTTYYGSLLKAQNSWKEVFDDKYADTVKADTEIVLSIANAKTYKELAEALSMQFVRLPSIKSELKTEDHIIYKDNRDSLKKSIKSASEYFRTDNKDAALFAINKSNELLLYLLDLFTLYYNDYKKEKKDRNVADFGDISHEAISIIRNNESVRKIYQDKFDEIMIDEFQDSNDLQDELFSLISRGDNLFMVGDVKQSIYAFRNATPSIFMRHKDEYEAGKQNGYVINLLENFRCRKNVVEAVNDVFDSIMTKELSGVDYSNEAKLLYGADVYTNDIDEEIYKAEITHITTSNGYTSDVAEARYIISKIKEYTDPTNGLDIFDKETKSFRKATYKDIVILSRNTVLSVAYLREFKKFGIPIVSTKTEGYFSASEIQLMLSVLSIIDNPRQDIPLVAVMLSPIGGFSEEEIARIKISGKNEPDFYDTLNKSIDEKAIQFLNWLGKIRGLAVSKNIVEIIDIILNDSMYLHYLQSLTVGDNRVANIGMLKALAKEYEESSYSGIFDFVRYIDMLQKYDMDLDEAQVLSDSNNVVRLMTIHKSKGLEFPIVFLARANGKINFSGSGSEKLTSYFDLYNNLNYISAPYVDLQKAAEYTTLSTVIIKEKNKIETLNEEMRLLYVAMTRAREKLIVVSSGGEDFSFINGSSSFSIQSSRSYLDFIKLSRRNESWKVNNISTDDVNEIVSRFVQMEILKIADFDNVSKSTCLDYEIDYNLADSSIKSIYSISEIKKSSDAVIIEGEQIAERPYKINNMSNSDAVLVGSAYHLLLEKIDPQDGEDIILVNSLLHELVAKQLIDSEIALQIDTNKICSFYNSQIGHEIVSAHISKKLFREKPFIMGVDSSLINENCSDEEVVIVQGVIDMYYIDNEGITLIDYKSNKIKEGEEDRLIDLYKTQIKYYAMSLERAYNMPVKRAYLYSIELNKFIEVN